MGRVKKYSKQHSNKKRKQSAAKQRTIDPNILQNTPDKLIVDQSDDEVMPELTNQQKALSVAKTKQIFKKSKLGRRQVKKDILQLKLQSKKLNKRNLDQKAQKKGIAKEIKELKVRNYFICLIDFVHRANSNQKKRVIDEFLIKN